MCYILINYIIPLLRYKCRLRSRTSPHFTLAIVSHHSTITVASMEIQYFLLARLIRHIMVHQLNQSTALTNLPELIVVIAELQSV